jgi:hypothetical protein
MAFWCMFSTFHMQDHPKECCQTFCTPLWAVAMVEFRFVLLHYQHWGCLKVTNNAYVIVAA